MQRRMKNEPLTWKMHLAPFCTNTQTKGLSEVWTTRSSEIGLVSDRRVCQSLYHELLLGFNNTLDLQYMTDKAFKGKFLIIIKKRWRLPELLLIQAVHQEHLHCEETLPFKLKSGNERLLCDVF